jgi:hypothetical protein
MSIALSIHRITVLDISNWIGDNRTRYDVKKAVLLLGYFYRIAPSSFSASVVCLLRHRKYNPRIAAKIMPTRAKLDRVIPPGTYCGLSFDGKK